MRYIWTLLLVGLLWAQEESRTPVKETTTRSAKVSPRSGGASRPAKEEVVVMETISGKVVDKKGKELGQAHLWFIDPQTGETLAESQTDSKGNFAVAVPRREELLVRIGHANKTSEKPYPINELLEEYLELVFE
ncbi:MAG: carboxypeptidase-like regulatory domain-containing protein [Bacteroidia bacterium]|nr:carboxypeptidase-like regulatory domain-containing protein [Bacteroidia bacterium]MDW8235563.1 hypothetical protein [Bacteroidia bacterium]